MASVPCAPVLESRVELSVRMQVTADGTILPHNGKAVLTHRLDVNPFEGSAVGREDSGLAPQPAVETSAREASRCHRGFLRGSSL
jgi:hypothetical protein